MKIFPIFIPFLGCPQKCIYCEQGLITNTAAVEKLSSEKVFNSELKERLAGFCSKNEKEISEIAFYGGSFTLLPEEDLLILLAGVKPFLPQVSGIRISTRPDGINSKLLDFCKSEGIKTIELGVQSFSDIVLERSKRSYGKERAVNSCKLIKANDIKLGVQLMPGLPGFSSATLAETVETVLTIKPDYVRIYPTIVLKSTKLEQLFRSGQYKPLTIESAVSICHKMITAFEKEQIPVIKTGLHSDLSYTEDSVIAGPYHPAFRELVNREILFQAIKEKLKGKVILSGNNYELIGTRPALAVSEKDKSLFFRDDRELAKKIKYYFNLSGLPVVFVPDFPALKAEVLKNRFSGMNYKLF